MTYLLRNYVVDWQIDVNLKTLGNLMVCLSNRAAIYLLILGTAAHIISMKNEANVLKT